MNYCKRSLFSMLVMGSLLTSGCSSGWLPFSSGQLEGVPTQAPADWTEVAAKEIIQLETNVDEPYSVNLWVIGEPTHLYVFAGASRAAWIEHIDKNPNIRMKIEDAIYDLVAERVTDAAEFERFAQSWEAKYGRRPRNENVDETYLMRLTAR
ncbi:MAG: hypothetical protein AAF541_03590 [Pseudomonadota bacterium]